MTTSEWARTSISVFDSDGDVAETVDLAGVSLEEQLAAAEVWLTDYRPDSGDVGNGVRLYCSWTPAEGRRAMTLPATLVRALAEAQGVFWMDTYPPDDAD